MSENYLWQGPPVVRESAPKFKIGDRVASAGVRGTVEQVSVSVTRGGWQYVVKWDDGVVFKRAFAEDQLYVPVEKGDSRR